MQAAAFETASRPMRGGSKAESSASPIAPIPAPRSWKCRAISRRSLRKRASRPYSPATPTPAAPFPFTESDRHAAGAADVGRRFQLPLFFWPQERGRTRDLCQRHRQPEQPGHLPRRSRSPSSAPSRTRWSMLPRWRRALARPATSRSTASISIPTRRF